MKADAISIDASALVDAFNPIHCIENSELARTIEQLAALTLIEGVSRDLCQEEVRVLWATVVQTVADLRWSFVPLSRSAAELWETRQNSSFWHRVDPKLTLWTGNDLPSFYDPARADIEEAAGKYLQFPWLSHPTVDFAIVDALVSVELCAFGQEAKAAPVFGLVNNLVKAFAEARANGDQEKLIWELLKIRAMAFFAIYVLPVGLLLWFGIASENGWAIVAGIGWAGFYALRLIWKMIVTTYRRAFKIQDPHSVAITLWNKMLGVHRALSGSVLSPTTLKAVVEATKRDGAGWSQTIDVILDRRARTSEAWVISPTMEGIVDTATRQPKNKF